MAERKAISKKIRFEIFKRDSFTCQYCGSKAPDVILEIDHITPVKHKGKNDILNLITSCFDCNRGKSDRQLSDTTIITIQRTQVEELQERKNQIEMMLEWKIGMVSTTDVENQKCIDFFNSKFETQSLSELGEKNMRTNVKKYGSLNVINAIDECYRKYANSSNEADNVLFIIKRIKSTLRYNTLTQEEKENWDKVGVVLKRCRAKFYGYNFDYPEATKAITIFQNRGGSIEELFEITENTKKFSEWKSDLYYYNR